MNMVSDNICYLNGRYLPLGDATVSVLDRGFIFSDSVYEVVPAPNRELFLFEQHLTRLDHSLRKIGIKNPISHEGWTEIAATILRATGEGNWSLYIQISRGVAPRVHWVEQDSVPTVFAMCQELEASHRLQSVKAITTSDNRWGRCDIKSTGLLPNVLAKREAVLFECSDAIFIKNGMVTEATASNVFVVKDRMVSTPPLSRQILPGITRDLLIDLLTKNDISNEQIPISENRLRQSDEIWLTSSTRNLVAVSHLDGNLIGTGEYPIAEKGFALLESRSV